MTLQIIVLIILAGLFVGALPRWQHSFTWGYTPCGAIGVLMLIVLYTMVTGGNGG